MLKARDNREKVGSFVTKKADVQTLETDKCQPPIEFQDWKVQLFCVLKRKMEGVGVWGEAQHDRRVGKQFWQWILERGKRGDRMRADQYGGYLPDQLWSLPHDTGRSATITVQVLQFFDDGISHRLSMFFCNLSTFTLRQNYCVRQVSSRDISVGVWPGYGGDCRGIVVWFQAGGKEFSLLQRTR